jgi:hypothetical protein
VADYTGADPTLVRRARWIAAAGSTVLSPLLLILDLGRPKRFLHRARVFKPVQTAESHVGRRVDAGGFFGRSGGGSVRAVYARQIRAIPSAKRARARGAGPVSYFRVSVFELYGCLDGASAILVWNEHVGDLPIHFGMSGLSAAVGTLELMGHEKSKALQMLGLGTATFECWEGWRIEGRRSPALNPLKQGPSGAIVRTSGFALRNPSLWCCGL